MTATKERCAECGMDMYRKWRGARAGNRVLCLQCNLNGYRLDSAGAVYKTGPNEMRAGLVKLQKTYEARANEAIKLEILPNPSWVFYFGVSQRLKGLVKVSPFTLLREVRSYYTWLNDGRQNLLVASDHGMGKRLDTLLQELEHVLTLH